MSERFTQERLRWERETLAAANEQGLRAPSFQTSSGIPLEGFYGPSSTEENVEQLGFPGDYPFTRGIYPTMYRGRFWTMRQYAGLGDAIETNKRYHFLLGQGVMGLSVAFDLPTQMGYDSDHPLAQGEVGRVGVAINTVEDMAQLFAGIPLERVSTSMTINATAAILLCMYITVAGERGIASRVLRGTVQNDILKEYIARGTYIYPPEPSLRLVTDLFCYCQTETPHWNPISISGYHIREAGATAAQEIAFTLANAITYVERARGSGLAVDRFGEQLSFFFNAHNHFFEEIAKFRAARRLWARIMKERFGATNPRAMMLRFHTQTAGCTLTQQEPENNVSRVTLQALAAVLGGTQSLHTNSRDEALSLPSEESARIALRTQQVIAYESGVADTPDPLGGSYYVEALTNALEEKAKTYLAKVDEMGGAIAAIQTGYFQREIENAAYDEQKAIEEGKNVVVGVNKFQEQEGQPPWTLVKVSPELANRQLQRLVQTKAGRNATAVLSSLAALETAACGRENLLPAILAAVKVRATVGEISDTLRKVFGQYQVLL